MQTVLIVIISLLLYILTPVRTAGAGVDLAELSEERRRDILGHLGPARDARAVSRNTTIIVEHERALV